MARTPSPARETRALPKTSHRINYVLRVDAALFHHFAAGRAQPELVQPNNFAIETDVLIPNLGHASFDCDTFAARIWKDLFAVF